MTQTQLPPKGLTLIISLMTMIGPLTIDTYLPSFPDIEAEYGISRALLTQSLAFYLAAFAISSLILGPLADRLGRRLVILGSLVFYIGASIGCALSDNYSSFLLFRLCQGIAAGGCLVAGRAMIRDVFSPQDAQKAMSRVMMLFAIAPALAPIIGGILHDLFGWHSVFIFLTLYGGFILVLFAIQIAETLHPDLRQSFHPANVTRVYFRTLVHRRFQFLVFMVGCYFAGLFLYIAGSPTIIFDYIGLSTTDFAVMFVPMVTGMMVGSWLSGRLAHSWPAERTIWLGLGVMTTAALCNAVLAFSVAPSVVTVVGPLVLYTCGLGIAMPACSILALDCFPQNRGSASAMQGFVQMIGNTLVASVAIPLLANHPTHMALGQLILIMVALLLWWRLPASED